jgi:hypothetical protein
VKLATTESYVHKIDSPEVTSAFDAALSARLAGTHLVPL